MDGSNQPSDVSGSTCHVIVAYLALASLYCHCLACALMFAVVKWGVNLAWKLMVTVTTVEALHNG
jgi:hypothetical protein